jgi:hypothetical protein
MKDSGLALQEAVVSDEIFNLITSSYEGNTYKKKVNIRYA